MLAPYIKMWLFLLRDNSGSLLDALLVLEFHLLQQRDRVAAAIRLVVDLLMAFMAYQKKVGEAVQVLFGDTIGCPEDPPALKE